jgi:hypothetical protein
VAVSKGAELPKERMLDAVEATARGASTFETWAGVKAPDLPSNEVDAMQVTLARWQNDRFANAPTSDVHMALGVIEELGEAFDEDADAEAAIDGFGDVMVYAAQLCTRNRLAVGPVIELAVSYLQSNRCYPQPICIAGMMAHIALKHDQGIRGLGPAEAYRPRLVDALAMMIAKALEICTIGHELIVDPLRVFLVIGAEVTQRKQGDAMIPKVSNEHEHAAQYQQRPTVDEALANMHGAIDALGPGIVADPAPSE